MQLHRTRKTVQRSYVQYMRAPFVKRNQVPAAGLSNLLSSFMIPTGLPMIYLEYATLKELSSVIAP